MPKNIQLCLVYRDMWQSSGKYMPSANQLVKVAEPIISMKCWDRIETNGGGFEQIQLLAGENPNEVVRKWTKPFNEVGIKTQMLERGLNALSMSPVAKDVRKLMFDVKSKQGTNISRSFDGLNDSRNLELSIKYANSSGMISQSCLCITHSEIHNVDYYIGLAKKLIKLGTKEIAIKDMAGIGRPSSLGKIVKGIKNFSPNTIVQYHGHSGPGFSVASSLEVARAGADIIDVSMEPLSWGTTHADLLTIHELLRDDGFSVKDYDKKAYMEVKQLTQEFIDEKKERKSKRLAVLIELKNKLNLKNIPFHVECYDISNIQGSNTVASLVTFQDGYPNKKEYRRFKIRDLNKPDDFESMKQVIRRRYKRVIDEGLSLPDLIIVDGGKGQLSSACEALKELDLYNKVNIIGLAKKLEEVYFPNDSMPILLSKKSYYLKLLQQIRNEAHRFAINYHKDLRSKNFLKSSIETIKGIGEKTRLKLINKFGSLDKLKEVDNKDIENVIGKKKTEVVIDFLKNKN